MIISRIFGGISNAPSNPFVLPNSFYGNCCHEKYDDNINVQDIILLLSDSWLNYNEKYN
jgi:hypothetical protein